MSEERLPGEPGEAEDFDLLDEELGLEPEEPEEPEEPVQLEVETEEPVPQPRRGDRRIAALRQQRREALEENRRLRDQLVSLSQPRQPAWQPQPDPYRQAALEQQEAERVMQMAPHEAAAYYANKASRELRQEMANTHLQTRDFFDRQSFETLARSNPAAKRLVVQVEETLAAARREGMNPTRQAVFELLVGREYLAKAEAAAERQRQTGKRRVVSQTTQPGTARSTATRGRETGNRDMSPEAIEARIGDIKF